MPFDEARQVIWPFRGLNAPIGKLIDERRINAQDLGFAMENARDARLRSAARTMMAYYLDLPGAPQPSITGSPIFIQASRYLQDEERWSFAEWAFVLGAVFGGGLMLIYLFITEWLRGSLTVPALLISLPLLVLVIREAYQQAHGAYRRYEAKRKGREGEDRVAAKLQAQLDGRWTVFRNLVLPGPRNDDLDFVLVGPSGVWVLEVKTYADGTRMNPQAKRSLVARFGREKTKPRVYPPDKQAESNAIRLRTLLGQRGRAVQWVHAAVLFPDYRPVDFVPTSAAEIWTAADLDGKLATLNSAAQTPDERTLELVESLRELPSVQSNTTGH